MVRIVLTCVLTDATPQVVTARLATGFTRGWHDLPASCVGVGRVCLKPHRHTRDS